MERKTNILLAFLLRIVYSIKAVEKDSKESGRSSVW